jgi:diacylglycerol kinase (ATP)
MRIAVIANPIAGGGRARALAVSVRAGLEGAGHVVSFAWTQKPGHAIELARQAKDRCDVVCAIGGDGTVHDVANGLLPDPLPLVLVPCGSGNDFSRLVGCPRTPGELMAVLDSGTGVRLDVVDCGLRYSVNSCGVGFEAQVAKHSSGTRRVTGLPLYLLAVAKAMREYACPRLSISLPGGEMLTGPKLLVSIGNGVSAGGGFRLTPNAVPDDGMADVCIVQAMSRLKMVRLLPYALTGAHTRLAAVAMRRASELSIRSDDPLPLHADGEYLGDGHRQLSFVVVARRLPVLCRKDTLARTRHAVQRLT